MAEAQQLAAEGVQELILISQITTNYGLDLYGIEQLVELLLVLRPGRCSLDSLTLRLSHRSHPGSPASDAGDA